LELEPKELHIRRLSSHKIFISKGEFKHTNNKVIINIYIYNRQKFNYLNSLKKIKHGLNKSKIIKLNNIRKNALSIINRTKIYKNLISKKRNILSKIKFNYYENMYRDDYITACYNREILYLFYKRLLLLNQLKFRYTYLQTIVNIIKKVYNKNVEFNMINLKYFNMNSDIVTQLLVNKITINRRKLNKVLRLLIDKVKIASNRGMQIHDEINTHNTLSIINSIDINKIKPYLRINSLDKLIYKIYTEYNIESDKRERILELVKNKYITGIRIEAAGRLSRRFTASRSIFKLKYKGSLRNRDSSYKGLSSTIMRGNLRSNIQYTKLSSIVKIGSFGLKG
jgi:Mitochondrial ribosomal protein (VAR1)